ncbi:unnamed protein product [Soboliphyme baturini]|uniref:Insulinoma-associated protein 1 n=1 Tax=Soboliphyme baturini TaxID=241478 RepID=A0A183IEL6_9BILA|nr:unnamed protein product [Soboliphyme baturini]
MAAALYDYQNPATLLTNPLQYAATLASLTQANYEPAASASALPFIYPHLYQSLLTVPSLEQLRQQLQSSTASALNAKDDCSGFMDSNMINERKLASISLTSPLQSTVKAQSTPSPRKRVNGAGGGSASTNGCDGRKQLSADTPKKIRAIRRIQFDDDENSSPVSGMYIRDLKDMPPGDADKVQDSEDLDDSAMWVEASEKARAELASIPNLLGDYICRLCRVRYEDAFKLARHRCPRIAHEEYRCPECDKVFSCPANLASHRRWHRPREKQPDLKKVVAVTTVGSYPLPPKVLAPVACINGFPQDNPLDLSTRTMMAAPPSVAAAAAAAAAANSVLFDNIEFSIYSCEFCGKKFQCHRLLRSHAIRHTSFAPQATTDQEIQCQEVGCDLWFLNAESQQKHLLEAHGRLRCNFCAELFSSASLLTKHINRCHSLAASASS